MIQLNRLEEIVSKFPELEKVLVLGDVGVDKYTFGEVTRISPEAPVPVVEVKKEWMKLGLAANVVDNLNSLGIQSTLCSVIGDDSHADLFETLLEEIDQKTWGIIRQAARHTTFKERVVTPTQQVCRVDYESHENISDESYAKLKDRYDEFMQGHSALIIEDYGKGLLTKGALEYAIAAAKEKGMLVTADPSRKTPPMWFKGVDVFKPNRIEAYTLAQSFGYTEKEDLNTVAEILIDKLELNHLIITLGAEGMLIQTRGEQAKVIPTFALEVFDVSGAGDTAISTLTAALVAGATLEEAAWVGNCASGVVVGKKGTALVTRDELINHYHRFEKVQNVASH